VFSRTNQALISLAQTRPHLTACRNTESDANSVTDKKTASEKNRKMERERARERESARERWREKNVGIFEDFMTVMTVAV